MTASTCTGSCWSALPTAAPQIKSPWTRGGEVERKGRAVANQAAEKQALVLDEEDLGGEAASAIAPAVGS